VIGRIIIYHGLNQNGHLPAQFSNKILKNLSTEPRTAQCTTTGQAYPAFK